MSILLGTYPDPAKLKTKKNNMFLGSKSASFTGHGAASAVHTSAAAGDPKSAASVHQRSFRDHLEMVEP
jgi:hypothetical protein